MNRRKWYNFLDACSWFSQITSSHDLDELVFCTDWAPVEHTLHEISHGVSLGWSSKKILDGITGDVERRGNAAVWVESHTEEVDKALKKLPGLADIDQEMHVWAIESVCLPWIGVHLERREIVEHAGVQGVLAEDMEDALDNYDQYVNNAARSLDILVKFSKKFPSILDKMK